MNLGVALLARPGVATADLRKLLEQVLVSTKFRCAIEFQHVVATRHHGHNTHTGLLNNVMETVYPSVWRGAPVD